MKAIFHLAVVAQCLALLVWVGGIVFFAFVAAPLTFQREVIEATGGTEIPGMIVRDVLGRLGTWETVCAAVILLALFEQIRQVPGRRGRYVVPLLLALAMTGLMVWYAYVIGPRMETLRIDIGNFNTADTALPAYLEFQGLHDLYERLMGVNLMLGAVLFVITVILIPSGFRDRDRSHLKSLGL